MTVKYEDMYEELGLEDLETMYDLMYDDSYSDMYYDIVNDDVSEYSLKDLLGDCLIPTVYEGVAACSKLFICCLIFRITVSLGYLPPLWIHITSATSGILCLYYFFDIELYYVIALSVLGVVSLTISHVLLVKYRGPVCALVCVIFLLVCELFLVDKAQWHKIRGSQMIVTMKIISLAFDIDSGLVSLPNPLECLGYFLCVGTVIFGPWISFTGYMDLQYRSMLSLQWFWSLVSSLFLAIVFLSVSTCWSLWFISDEIWKWLTAYRDALSFRTSHYFVCYISQASTILVGISQSPDEWDFTVSKPKYIEVPRSLVEVVVNWNIPMHLWLKTYVFKTSKPLGNFTAVILTYATSSLLHGINFQLAAVLFSLGFYTYVEYVLRHKLADTFEACILARPCKNDCLHVYKKNHPAVIVVNMCFGLLVVFHLAYLGVMFNASTSVQEEVLHPVDKVYCPDNTVCL
ncbi:protein-serine O-palmitoleoyltransferase por isoform X2 [Tachypleus tridentatus]|uniref:protein-serine O-palmitoleoyltransferase por isoform X2 n=1 Tax=Tachypleus tridentatus TaxID=6853 RepID=UPI003FD5425E